MERVVKHAVYAMSNAFRESKGKHEQSQMFAKLLVDHGLDPSSTRWRDLYHRANANLPVYYTNTSILGLQHHRPSVLGLGHHRSNFVSPGSSRNPTDLD